MAIYYIDPDNGDDSADGLTLNTSGLPTVGPWKTWTSGPTTARITDGDTIRFKETPQTSLGSCTWTNDSQTVTAGSSFGFYITQGSSTTGWTASANVSMMTGAFGRSATNAVGTNIASGFATGVASYFDYGSQVDLSAYNTLSLILGTTAQTIAANNLTINLCSDASGTTVVNAFTINHSITNSHFVQLTLPYGGSLGNNIRSVSLSFASDPGTTVVYTTDIIVTTGIGHSSLICKSDNLYYPIKCITSSTEITLGPFPDLFSSTNNPTYHGTTESVTTYFVNPYHFVTTGNYQTIPPERPDFNYINTIDGGYVWNGSSNVKSSTGITALKGPNTSVGAASTGSATHGWKIQDMVYSNGNVGISSGSRANIYENVTIVGFTTPYSQSTGASISFKNCNFICNRGTVAVGGACSFYNCKFLSVSKNNRLATIQAGDTVLFESCEFTGSCSYAIITGPSTNMFYSNPGAMLKNCLISPSSEFQVSGDNGIMHSLNHDQTADNNRIFSLNGDAYWQTTTYYGSNPGAWAINVSSSNDRTGQYFPFYLKLAEVAVTANNQVTINCWCKKNNASSVGAKICIVEELGILGATVVEDVKANDVNWEQLSIQFTPTSDGVIDIYGAAWRVSGAAGVYFGPITVTQV